jgi:hypothetical protein
MVGPPAQRTESDMNKSDMNKAATSLIVFGSGLTAFGAFAFVHLVYPGNCWSTENRIIIAIGVASAVWGVILRKDSREL